MSDLIERSDVIEMINRLIKNKDECIVKNESFRKGMMDGYCRVRSELCDVPSVQPDNRLSKIADLVEGTIDHFDLDDAMDLLYQIKEVLK